MFEQQAAASQPRTLVIRNWNAGFFSNFNGVLNNLHHRLGRDGIQAAQVEWYVHPDLTHFSYGRRADGNLWPPFFEPLRFDFFPPEKVEVQTYADLGMTWRHAYDMYKLDSDWRATYHALYRRHIKIAPRIIDRVEALHRATMAGRYCVGVHYRHPDHVTECPTGIPQLEEFIECVREQLPAGAASAVVLATDVASAVARFREVFGDALVVQPGVNRAETLDSGQFHHANGDSSTALGEQVLIDCLLLARCDALVHITSNIATAAGYINPALKMIYCEPTLDGGVPAH